MNDMAQGAKLLMTFEVTPTSHLLSEYRARGGYRLQEVPVSYRPRYAGRSKVSGTIAGSLKAGTVIIGTSLRYRHWTPQMECL